MKKHHTKQEEFCLTESGGVFKVPIRVLEKYAVTNKKSQERVKDAICENQMILAEDYFKKMDEKYGKAANILRGIRYREALSQKDFAEKIGVTQGDVSKMENGVRPIGKTLAKRIGKEFNVNYRYFLG